MPLLPSGRRAGARAPCRSMGSGQALLGPGTVKVNISISRHLTSFVSPSNLLRLGHGSRPQLARLAGSRPCVGLAGYVIVTLHSLRPAPSRPGTGVSGASQPSSLRAGCVLGLARSAAKGRTLAAGAASCEAEEPRRSQHGDRGGAPGPQGGRVLALTRCGPLQPPLTPLRAAPAPVLVPGRVPRALQAGSKAPRGRSSRALDLLRQAQNRRG